MRLVYPLWRGWEILLWEEESSGFCIPAAFQAAKRGCLLTQGIGLGASALG